VVERVDWVSQLADEVVAAADKRGVTGPVVCASGLSPSGPIHLGNFRELMMPHLVADEIRRRGIDCEHILSWDDYDRFRRVPAGVDPAWKEHIGKPLSHVPAPDGSEHANWAEHFKAPMRQAMDELGIEVRAISQSAQYTSGAYTTQILQAMRHRHRIDAILDRYRTRGRTGGGGPQASQQNGPQASQRKLSADDQVAAVLAAEGSGAAAEDDGTSAAGYFPYRPYCSYCDRDTTTVTAYDDATTELAYSCTCGHAETVQLSGYHRGKLVWKVDWPMRWAYENVLFEPSGVDHTSPGSSYDVGGQIVTEVFGGTRPIGPMYAFVGIEGMAKMSSSRGGVPTPAEALQIMETPVLRWLYARRKPNQAFTISLDQQISREHDEWDALVRRVTGGSALPADRAAYERAVSTASRRLPQTPRPVPYRTLASIADVTTGDPEQMLRILRDLDAEKPVTSLDEVRPRLERAQHWVATRMPADQRTRVREEPDTALLASLDESQREALRMLLDGLDSHWSLDGLTTLVYGIPKLRAGLSVDAKPTPELKVAQREFFALLYRLLVGGDTGPRLPTLLLAVGADRVRKLLAA
jgi:lysyl-tRNA synthetase, class I